MKKRPSEGALIKFWEALRPAAERLMVEKEKGKEEFPEERNGEKES